MSGACARRPGAPALQMGSSPRALPASSNGSQDVSALSMAITRWLGSGSPMASCTRSKSHRVAAPPSCPCAPTAGPWRWAADSRNSNWRTDQRLARPNGARIELPPNPAARVAGSGPTVMRAPSLRLGEASPAPRHFPLAVVDDSGRARLPPSRNPVVAIARSDRYHHPYVRIWVTAKRLHLVNSP